MKILNLFKKIFTRKDKNIFNKDSFTNKELLQFTIANPNVTYIFLDKEDMESSSYPPGAKVVVIKDKDRSSI